jgi:hypothetical protein
MIPTCGQRSVPSPHQAYVRAACQYITSPFMILGDLLQYQAQCDISSPFCCLVLSMALSLYLACTIPANLHLPSDATPRATGHLAALPTLRSGHLTQGDDSGQHRFLHSSSKFTFRNDGLIQESELNDYKI